MVEDTLGVSFQLDDPVTRAFLQDAGVNISGIAGNTVAMVRRAIIAGQTAGEGIDAIAKRIRECGAFTSGRARVIARTELGHAANTAAVHTYGASGLVESVKVYDGEVHPECAAWNGRIIPMAQMGSVPTLAHPNCVRAFGPIVSELPVADPRRRGRPPGARNKPKEVAANPWEGKFNADITSVEDINKKLDEINKKLGSDDPYDKIRTAYGNIADKLENDPKVGEKWKQYVKRYQGSGAYNKNVGIATARHIKDEWDGTSAGSALAVAMQNAVNAEFKLNAPTSHFGKYQVDDAKELEKEYGDVFKAFARAQYDETQKYLKDKGITEVYAWRGMKWSEYGEGKKPTNFDFPSQSGTGKLTPNKAKISMQPISSYSWNVDISLGFASYGEYSAMVGVRVPAGRVYSIPHTGAGVYGEAEYVILGSKEDVASVATWRESGRGGIGASQIIKTVADATKLERAKTWLRSELDIT